MNKSGKKATLGEKMIKLEILFHTSGLASVKGNILPKHAQTKGRVIVLANESHGIKSNNRSGFFNSTWEILPAIKKALDQNGIALRSTGKRRR